MENAFLPYAASPHLKTNTLHPCAFDQFAAAVESAPGDPEDITANETYGGSPLRMRLTRNAYGLGTHRSKQNKREPLLTSVRVLCTHTRGFLRLR